MPLIGLVDSEAAIIHKAYSGLQSSNPASIIKHPVESFLPPDVALNVSTGLLLFVSFPLHPG